MRRAREYLRHADALWRRHKARAVCLAVLAATCAACWLVKQAAVWACRHVRRSEEVTDER